MPARSSTASGARTGPSDTPSQSTQAKVSPSQTPKRSGLSMWSNLAYLTISRVEYLSHLERVVCPPEEGSEGGPLIEPDESSLCKTIIKKLVGYKRQDQAKGLRFSLKVDHILALREAQGNCCAACNIELLWVWELKDTQQFSVDRLDNTVGHICDSVRLTSSATEKEEPLRSALENPIRRKLSVGRHYEEFFPDKAPLRLILQVVDHRLTGLGHRASQSVHLKRPHGVCSASKAIFQLTRLVEIANANSRGDFLLIETNWAARNYRGGLLCAAAQRLGLDGIRGLFASQLGDLTIQSCDNCGQLLNPLRGPLT